MKNMIITATAVGAAIAGIVLYSRRGRRKNLSVKDAAKNAYDTMNKGIGGLERFPTHTMG
jgi:hypothetical protein